MCFQKVPEPKTVNNRPHLDLHTDHYQDEIARLIALGAERLGEIELPQIRRTTSADPECHEFDLLTW